jgi:hypothetical protein
MHVDCGWDAKPLGMADPESVLLRRLWERALELMSFSVRILVSCDRFGK